MNIINKYLASTVLSIALLSPIFPEEAKPTLEYTPEAYQNHYQNELVSAFSHGLFAVGPVDGSKATSIINFLNGNIHGISFHTKKVANKLEGGACSALALRVAREAVPLIQALDRGQISREQVLSTLKQYVATMRAEEAKKNLDGHRYRTHIRTIQAAFNTIHVNAALSSDEAAKAKVRAIAAYYDLDATTFTPTLHITKTTAFEEELAQEMQALEPGVYLVRIVQPTQNEKREVQGHSTIYIKHPQLVLYFDVNIGLYDGSAPDSKLVYHALRGVCSKFHVDRCTFYKLTDHGRGFHEQKMQVFPQREGKDRR